MGRSAMDGTPLSSQIVFLEKKNAELEEELNISMGNTDAAIEDYNKQLEENEKLKNILRKAFPEASGHYFICGEAGEKDSSGLPDKVFVCPTYGLDGFQVYKKDGDYRAPGW